MFEGQDLGPSVQAFFGVNEYEWRWVVSAEHIPRLLEALGGDDVLEAIADRFSGDRAGDVHAFLTSHGVPFATWTRLGD